MITSNAFDTFRMVFNDGDELCLIARDSTHARLTAMELNPGKEIVRLHKLGLWEDDN